MRQWAARMLRTADGDSAALVQTRRGAVGNQVGELVFGIGRGQDDRWVAVAANATTAREVKSGFLPQIRIDQHDIRAQPLQGVRAVRCRTTTSSADVYSG
jgi:hypothetical protein